MPAHHPLVELSENLWTVEADDMARVPIPRRMCAIKLSTGELVIHSAIVLDDAGMEALEGWGRPAYLIVPNAYHRMDAPRYVERYPDIEVMCPPEARGRVAKVVRVDGGFELLPEDPALRIEVIGGGKAGEAALLVTSADGVSAVFCDSVFNVAEPSRGGPAAWALKLIGSIGGPRVTRLARVALVGDRAAFADNLRTIARTPDLVRVIPGHGDVIDQDAPAVLMSIADRLYSPR